MDADQVGDDAEGGQRHDVDLGVAEEPEQVLKQYRAAAAVTEMFPHLDDGRHEEAGLQKLIQRHHDGADEQSRKRQQRQNGGDENAPYRQRQPHQRHPPRAGL